MPEIKNNTVKHSEFLIARDNRLLRYAGTSKNENLTAKNDSVSQSSESLEDIQAIIAKIKEETETMRDRIMDLEMALAWYGSRDNWRAMAVHSDKGDRARSILNKGREVF